MKFRAALVILGALLLGSCSRPYFTSIVNNTGERLVIVRALLGGDSAMNVASEGWPGKSKPEISPAGSHTLTSYGPGDGWSRWDFVFELGGRCTMTFAAPAAPTDHLDRPDWRIYLAYGESVFQLDADRRLYRSPANGRHGPADVTRLPQPEGYPLTPTRSNC